MTHSSTENAAESRVGHLRMRLLINILVGLQLKSTDKELTQRSDQLQM